VVTEEEIDFGYDNDFYGESAVVEEHELESAKRQLTHDDSYYSYYSYYYYSYYDYSSYDYSSYYYSYYSYYYYSYYSYYSGPTYYYSYYSGPTYYYSYYSSYDYSYSSYDYSYSSNDYSYSSSSSYSDSSSSIFSDDSDYQTYYLTDESCDLVDGEYAVMYTFDGGETFTYYDTNYTYCNIDVATDYDGSVSLNISAVPEYTDYGYYCVDGWETSAYTIDYDTYKGSIEGPYGTQLVVHDYDSFNDLLNNLTEECASSDYDDYYNYDSYYSYGDSYDSYDYYYYDYYYGDSYYYEEEEKSAYDYLAGEWEYISEAYMGDGSIFIKATIATTAMVAAVSV